MARGGDDREPVETETLQLSTVSPGVAASSESPAIGSKARFGVKSLGIAYEALASLRGRSMRTWMTAVGIALGIAATVATVGLSSTSAAAIAERFDATEATEVTVSFSNTMRDAGYAPDAEDGDRVRGIEGVAAAGIMCASGEEVAAARTPEAYYERSFPVYGMEPGAMEAYGFAFAEGAAFDDGHVDRGDKVAIMDASAARDLGYTSLEGGPMVYLDGEGYALVGIYEAPEGEAKLTSAIVIPRPRARPRTGASRPRRCSSAPTWARPTRSRRRRRPRCSPRARRISRCPSPGTCRASARAWRTRCRPCCWGWRRCRW
ncbi:hypothetical protein GCM10029992_02810 [Glycomyces albus]